MKTKETINLIECISEIGDIDYCCDCVSDTGFSDFSDAIAQFEKTNRPPSPHSFK